MTGTIVYNKEISDGIFEMSLAAKEVAQTAKAGQFVMLYLDKPGLLLPRPISICFTEGDNIILVYKIAGEGTKYMSEMQTNNPIRLMGPLGNGFTVKESVKKAALIGGGIGTPPMVMLQKALNIKTDVYLGFYNKSILTEHFSDSNVYVATETGAEGTKGNVTDLLRERAADYDEMYACGPTAMLAAVAKFASERSIPLQVCLEERMACGLGSCVGCVVPTKDKPKYKKICCEGPVFYSDEVLWDE